MTKRPLIKAPPFNGPTLDPQDWPSVRTLAHKMLDDMFDYIAQIRDRPVWQPIPEDVRKRFRKELPYAATSLEMVYEEFFNFVLPYSGGNVHPAFMGWVQGGGNVAGMLAEMLAGALNANVGGRDQAPLEVERQIVAWMRQIFDFPLHASGLFVTGTSMANFLAVLIARNSRLGLATRERGLGDRAIGLRAYASKACHGCIARAMDFAGLGSSNLRLINIDSEFRMDLDHLHAMIAQDRLSGLEPFLVIGSAGTVDAGAIDGLKEIAAISSAEKLWFHVDGAYGALGILSPDIAPKLEGITLADSIGFDFHKWVQVPYDAGFLLVRDGKKHYDSFASQAAYLGRETRGLAGGSPWPCDYGPDLSRGFRALKTWFTLRTYGIEAIADVIARSCRLAQYLQSRITERAELELLAPAQLNIVCFRYCAQDADKVNAAIVADLQESGIAAPSATIIDGKVAIRAALFNHRTQPEDIDALIEATLNFGACRSNINTAMRAKNRRTGEIPTPGRDDALQRITALKPARLKRS